MRPLSFILPWSRHDSLLHAAPVLIRFRGRTKSKVPEASRKPPHLKGTGFLVFGVVDPGDTSSARPEKAKRHRTE